MSTAARRRKIRSLRRRLDPDYRYYTGPGSGLIKIRVTGDASKARRQLGAAQQALVEHAAAAARAGMTARQAAARFRAFIDAMYPDRHPGHLEIFCVTTAHEGCRLIVQRVGGWDRKPAAPTERNR